MAAYLSDIERLIKELGELRPLKPEDQERLDKKFRLEFNYNSNHIEGNTLTYGETKLLLLFDKTTGNHEHREYEEMKAHDVAFEMIKEWAADVERPLSEMQIKNLNEILLVRPFWKEAQTESGENTRRKISIGSYKEFPNSVRLQNGEMFNYASPSEVPVKMGELIEWYRKEEEANTLHPIVLAAMMHYKFVLIHPFDDGNGRIARLLMNYILLKNDLPPVIIRSADKKNYLFALNQADSGNLEAFLQYITLQLSDSLEMNIKAAKGESIEEKDDWEKELDLFKKKTGISPLKKVSKYNSEEAVTDIYLNTILPFASAWEEQLTKFDILFFKKEVITEIEFYNKTIEIKQINFNNLHNYLEHANYFPFEVGVQKINLIAEYSNLRSLPTKSVPNNFFAGFFSVVFHTNAYELNFKNAFPSRSLLYGEYLTQEEINEIVSNYSAQLFKKISEAQ